MKTIFGISADTIDQFEVAAKRTAECGATHLVITENLPVARWQFDTPGDPYPAWYAFQPGLLKTFPPDAILPFVDAGHARKVGEILGLRCEILRRYQLRGVYHTTEPQVLPEAVFAANPGWRGPRVDQPNRSRVARFAPCVGHPEIRRLYVESIQLLLRHCPEIDTLLFLTIDSGSGFCWAPSLYPGPNGCNRCSGSDVGHRAVDFVKLLGDAAINVGASLEIDLVEIEPRSWMRKTFGNPGELAACLPAGLSINHHEGPDGSRFTSGRFSNLFFNAFYPVVGLPRPLAFVRRLSENAALGANRTIVSFNDGLNTELNTTIFQAYQRNPASDPLGALQLLWQVAEQSYGADSAAQTVQLWSAIDDAEKQLGSLDFGPFVLMGGLLARWITRPFVPFPEELDEKERESFYPFLFQARDEASALNIVDIQAMRMFEGWGARLLVEQTVEVSIGHLHRARVAAESLENNARFTSAHMIARLDLLTCLLRTGRNAVAYQAQLERLRTAMNVGKPLPPPPLGASSAWDYLDLVNTARAEIDNTVQTLEIVETYERSVIDLAPEGEQESIMRFTSRLHEHLQKKIQIMGNKWGDYNRLAQPANP